MSPYTLLKRWAELEPERCNVSIGLDEEPVEGEFCITEPKTGESYWIEVDPVSPSMSAIDSACLQFTLQLAIAHRNWICQLHRIPSLGWEATVRCESDRNLNPAIALLTAYIKALEVK
ncbi:hypothetical protein ACQ4M4_12755 [Leptolyngbya sp. AN02str]|uniref:hypothetical protein n=1 Tax=Leptolyngbya sp. AN02str TaxID=3423363 RepID=UPI003D3226DD